MTTTAPTAHASIDELSAHLEAAGFRTSEFRNDACFTVRAADARDGYIVVTPRGHGIQLAPRWGAGQELPSSAQKATARAVAGELAAAVPAWAAEGETLVRVRGETYATEAAAAAASPIGLAEKTGPQCLSSGWTEGDWTPLAHPDIATSTDLASGIAAYRRTWARFDGLVCSAQCGADPDVRQTGVFNAGECQPTITTAEGRRFAVRDLGSLRVLGGAS